MFALKNKFLETRRRRIAIRQLESLDNNYLRDIGIERAQIPEVVEDLLHVPPPKRRRRARHDDWRKPLEDARWAIYAARSVSTRPQIA